MAWRTGDDMIPALALFISLIGLPRATANSPVRRDDEEPSFATGSDWILSIFSSAISVIFHNQCMKFMELFQSVFFLTAHFCENSNTNKKYKKKTRFFYSPHTHKILQI